MTKPKPFLKMQVPHIQVLQKYYPSPDPLPEPKIQTGKNTEKTKYLRLPTVGLILIHCQQDQHWNIVKFFQFIFYFDCLSFWPSSIWLSSIFVSSILVVFNSGRLPFLSSSTYFENSFGLDQSDQYQKTSFVELVLNPYYSGWVGGGGWLEVLKIMLTQLNCNCLLELSLAKHEKISFHLNSLKLSLYIYHNFFGKCILAVRFNINNYHER